MKQNRITPEQISSLKDNEVFVFGSNVQGEHLGGAALFAEKHFGAIYGLGEGLQGKSYAIPSCTRVGERAFRFTQPFSDAKEMKPYVDRFIEFAKEHRELHFFVTKIGCGIAAMPIQEVADVFKGCVELDNVSLPLEFWNCYMVDVDKE